MVICQANDGNRQLLVFGLSRQNVERLQDGQPIRVSHESHGMAVPENLTVILFFGETEGEIERMLRSNGLIDPGQTVVNQQRPT